VVSGYVEEWLRFQSLWDLQSEQVYDALGDNLGKWLQLLHEIRKSRSTFDTSDVSRSFGNLIIDYEQVQTKVNAKYDQWQHDILIKFANKLGNRMREAYAEIGKARKDLEGQSLEASSTAQAVSFITIVQQSKRKVKAWAPEVELFKQGETTLTRQRYQFPNDWLYVDQISGEWTSLNEILARKSKIVQDQTGRPQFSGLHKVSLANDHVQMPSEQRLSPRTGSLRTRSPMSLRSGTIRSPFLEPLHLKMPRRRSAPLKLV
jgi:dynein heavy chain 1